MTNMTAWQIKTSEVGNSGAYLNIKVSNAFNNTCFQEILRVSYTAHS